ncbi:hypothetical protein CsSME_00004956 [Camellia sinensis var. sinensis]
MRNGSCGYGARCRFHHPDPTDIGGYDPRNSTPNEESIGQFGRPSENYNGESIPLHVSGASQPAQASWSSQMPSDKAVPYQDNHSSCMPTMHIFHQEAPKWNGYQVAFFWGYKLVCNCGHSRVLNNFLFDNILLLGPMIFHPFRLDFFNFVSNTRACCKHMLSVHIKT